MKHITRVPAGLTADACNARATGAATERTAGGLGRKLES